MKFVKCYLSSDKLFFSLFGCLFHFICSVPRMVGESWKWVHEVAHTHTHTQQHQHIKGIDNIGPKICRYVSRVCANKIRICETTTHVSHMHIQTKANTSGKRKSITEFQPHDKGNISLSFLSWIGISIVAAVISWCWFQVNHTTFLPTEKIPFGYKRLTFTDIQHDSIKKWRKEKKDENTQTPIG